MYCMQPQYIVGLTDGEGCFTINIRAWKKNKSGYSVSAAFHIELVESAKIAVEGVQKTLDCGTIVPKIQRKQPHYQPQVDYHVTNLQDITGKVIPFFNENKLLIKQQDFELWKKAIALIIAKVHLTREGVNQIDKIRRQMNFRPHKTWKYP